VSQFLGLAYRSKQGPVCPGAPPHGMMVHLEATQVKFESQS